MKDKKVQLNDQMSVERMLTNAEIDFESFEADDSEEARIEAENGVIFAFDEDGMLVRMG